MEPADKLDLTPPERRMWDAVMRGEPCILGDDDPRKLTSKDIWDPELTIRGEVLADLLMRAGGCGNPSQRQVQIQGARVIGEINVSHAELAVAVEFNRCLFADDLMLWFTRARALQADTCVLASVSAIGACIEGVLGIIRSCVRGEISLIDARVSRSVVLAGSTIAGDAGRALSADRLEVGGDLFLRDGFHARGEVSLLGVRIGNQLNCADGRFVNPGGDALNLQESRAHALLLRGPCLKVAGDVRLIGANVSTLADDPASLAAQNVTLRLDGFAYKHIAPDSPSDVRTRLQWLGRQGPGYHPQPFDQLAAVLLRNGQDREARDVLIAKRRKRRETLPRLRSKCWDWFLDKSVLYGWQPWRPVVGGSTVFLVVLGLVIGAQAVGLVVGTADTMSSYHPLVHAIDVFLPVVDLGVESRWTIDTVGGWFAWLVMACLWFLKLVGWGTVTLALAAVTGVVKRK